MKLEDLMCFQENENFQYFWRENKLELEERMKIVADDNLLWDLHMSKEIKFFNQ